MRHALATAGLAVGTSIAILTACGSAMSGYDPTVPTHITYVDGGDQRGRVDSPLEKPFLAKITNQIGSPVAGVRVDWYIVAGGGRLSDSTSISDSEGMVCNTLRLGPSVETIRVQAVTNLSGSPVYFNASAIRYSGGGEAEPAVCTPAP